jgi:recombination associated protein RdgC
MWFRNLQLYRLPAPWRVRLATLEEQLARRPFHRCGGQDAITRGWVAPRPGGPLAHALAGQWLIALCVEQRLLPASVIRDEVEERASVLAEQQGHPPGRKQLRELRERVGEELLPRAFTRRRTMHAWIDPKAGWLVIDAASAAKAEELVELLRASLDELPLSLLHTELSPTAAMADWLAGGEAPAGFTIDRDCELKAAGEDKAAVRYVHHSLEGDEVRGHLAGGKLPTRLALTWNDRLSFVLTEKLEIKRLAFLDLVNDEAERRSEDADQQFDADFALMTGELTRFLPPLLAALGGEKAPG